MVHDDDTGRRVYFPIRSEDRVSPRKQTVRLPSEQTQQLVLRLAERPGWKPERIHAHLRQKYNRHDVSLNAIRHILSQPRVRRPR